jgi:hypothetical protein
MNSLMLIAALQAATPLTSTARPLAADYQLSCAILAGGSGVANTINVDFSRKRGTVVTIVGPGGAAPIDAVGRVLVGPSGGADNSLYFGLTSAGMRYRVEIMPDAFGPDGFGRIRLMKVLGREVRPTVAQGLCWSRKGKALPFSKKTTTLDYTDTFAAGKWEMATIPTASLDRTCHVLTADRKIHALTYRIGKPDQNEITPSYSTTDAGVTGSLQGQGNGIQFYLTAPHDKLISTTTIITGSVPETSFHVTFERLGNWIDISRGGKIVAVGECGAPIPSLSAGLPLEKDLPQ